MRQNVWTICLVMAVLANVAGAGLVSHWTFDETTGTIANDSIGGNHGLIFGADSTSGKIDGALDFDGDDDYVDVGDRDSLDFGAADSFSIAMWIKSSETNGAIVYKRSVDSVGFGEEGYGVKIHENKLYFAIEDSSGLTAEIFGGTIVNDNAWHHVVAVRNADTDKIDIYLDGVSDATSVTDSTAALNTGSNLNIGRMEYYDIDFAGKIDDVRIYNHALSQTEITNLVPEPTTLIILGLGGFLLRKKQ